LICLEEGGIMGTALGFCCAISCVPVAQILLSIEVNTFDIKASSKIG
jgi:hypothetical protein